MAAKSSSDRTVLVSPSGEEYETGDKSEVTRLRAAGYTDKKPRASKS